MSKKGVIDRFKEYEAYESIRRQKASFKNSDSELNRDEIAVAIVTIIAFAFFLTLLISSIIG